MGYIIGSFIQFIDNLVEHLSHGLFPVQHCPSFLIAFDKVANISLEILVYFFVFQNTHHTAIDFRIEDLELCSLT